MKVFSRNSTPGNHPSKQSDYISTTPKFYVLASQPTSHGEADWGFEIESPLRTSISSASGINADVQSQGRKQSLLSSLKIRRASDTPMQTHQATEPSSSSSLDAEGGSTTETLYINPVNGSLGRTTLIPNPVLRISTPLSPEYTSNSSFQSTTQTNLPDHMEQALRAATSKSSLEQARTPPQLKDASPPEAAQIHSQTIAGNKTNLGASCLRNALLTLQSAQILPNPDQGFDVEKFVYFATSKLEDHCYKQQQQQQHSPEHETRNSGETDESAKMITLDYAQFLEDNAALRRQIGREGDRWSGSTVNDEERNKNVEDGEQHVQSGMHVKRKRIWGGFWITYGGYGESDNRKTRTYEDQGDDDERLRPRNPYGGLM